MSLRNAGRVGAGAAAAVGIYAYNNDSVYRSAYFWMHAFPIYLHYRTYQLYISTCNLPHDEEARIYGKLHARHAENVFSIVHSLRGFYIKLAQAGSTRSDFLPLPYLSRAIDLQDNAPFAPIETILDIISESYGAPWQKVFDNIDPLPLGAASIGQTHRAILKSSQKEVAVKVQHRNAERYFRSDIKTIKTFCRYFQPVHLPYLEEIEKQFMTEFNYIEEARNLEAIRINISKSPYANRIVIPEPMLEMCTKQVLVMQFLRGKKLLQGIHEHFECIAEERQTTVAALRIQQQKEDDERHQQGLEILSGPSSFTLQTMALYRQLRHTFAAVAYRLGSSFGYAIPPPVPPKKLLNISEILGLIMDVHGYELFINGCFNGDPHPGNILLLDDDRIGLIDYGQVKRIHDETRKKLAHLTLVLANGTRDDIVRVLTMEMDVQSRNMNPYFLEKQAHLMFDSDDRQITEGMNVLAFSEYLNTMDEITHMPDEYVMAFRMSLLLRGFSYALHYPYSHAKTWAPFARQVVQE